MQRLHAFVYGRVQGVFFRAFVRQVASELGLTGWVRNCDDGSVEVVAEGPQNKLEKLLAALKRGPPAAKVDRADAKWEKADGRMKGFEVLRDGCNKT